jgi:ATP-dependent Clp protease ATP-binding subunit ClpC
VTRTVERAEQYAAELGHPYVGTNHLLMALLSDHDGAGCHLLRDMGVDDATMRTDIAHQLGFPAKGTD